MCLPYRGDTWVWRWVASAEREDVVPSVIADEEIALFAGRSDREIGGVCFDLEGLVVIGVGDEDVLIECFYHRTFLQSETVKQPGSQGWQCASGRVWAPSF